MIKSIKIKVSDLNIGDVVEKVDTSWLNNPFIKKQFTIESNAEIHKLKEYKVEHVYIQPRNKKYEPKIEDEKIPEVNLNDYYIELDQISNSFDLYRKSVSIVKNVMTDVRTGKLFNKTAITSVSRKMVEITKYNKNILASVSKLKSYDEYTFEHSMNISVFSSSLAQHMNLPAEEIEMLTIGGLLHDTGKMLVPQDILNKPGKLTGNEFSIMKKHVEYGYDYLKKQGFNESQLRIVVEHHERHDGSGYPNGLLDKDISLHGKIGAVVDIYDAITSNRVYHKGMEAATALKMMFKWTDSHINKKVFDFFIAHVGIFPVGTLVVLNTNELAIVGLNSKNPTAPMIVVFSNPKGSFITPFLVDLTKKSVAQRKILGPVNPSKINIPDNAHRMVEEMNSKIG